MRKTDTVEFEERKSRLRSGPRARIRSARIGRLSRTVVPEHESSSKACPRCQGPVFLWTDHVVRCANGHIWTP